MAKLTQNFDLVAVLILALVLGVAKGSCAWQQVIEIGTQREFHILQLDHATRLIRTLPMLR